MLRSELQIFFVMLADPQINVTHASTKLLVNVAGLAFRPPLKERGKERVDWGKGSNTMLINTDAVAP